MAEFQTSYVGVSWNSPLKRVFWLPLVIAVQQDVNIDTIKKVLIC